MKTKTIIALLLSVAFIATCSKPPIQKAPVKPQVNFNDFETEGFLGENDFQVKTSGKPIPSATGFTRRRRQAVNDAIRKAHDRIVIKLAEYLGGDNYKSQIEESLKSTIYNGQAVYKKYSSGEKAQITYRITQDGLKGNVDLLK